MTVPLIHLSFLHAFEAIALALTGALQTKTLSPHPRSRIHTVGGAEFSV